ncbi:hypothetical protein B0H14DRAFT_2651741 [Mycena olivaceomarginata]|nr:hypothetical protein B0H14DRAFT_2651741 [Mycena olivaceomarginata]
MPPIQGLAAATSVGSGDSTILLDLEAYIDRQWRGWLARCGTSHPTSRGSTEVHLRSGINPVNVGRAYGRSRAVSAFQGVTPKGLVHRHEAESVRKETPVPALISRVLAVGSSRLTQYAVRINAGRVPSQGATRRTGPETLTKEFTQAVATRPSGLGEGCTRVCVVTAYGDPTQLPGLDGQSLGGRLKGESRSVSNYAAPGLRAEVGVILQNYTPKIQLAPGTSGPIPLANRAALLGTRRAPSPRQAPDSADARAVLDAPAQAIPCGLHSAPPVKRRTSESASV